MSSAEHESTSPDVRLSPSSAVVLGLLGSLGPQTTYDMMNYVSASIGYFWPFPNSQMYAETKRLEAAGLITGEQEDTGRRRRVYAITESGSAALAAWLDEPVDRQCEIRDIGLLKLFISDAVPGASVRELAADRVRAHSEQLAEYEAIAAGFEGDRSFSVRTIDLGIAFERVAIEFWTGVERDA